VPQIQGEQRILTLNEELADQAFWRGLACAAGFQPAVSGKIGRSE
jgi:hypothetical protein